MASSNSVPQGIQRVMPGPLTEIFPCFVPTLSQN
eukprot:gene16582-biopygen1221